MQSVFDRRNGQVIFFAITIIKESMGFFRNIGHTFSNLGKSIHNTAHNSAQSALKLGHHYVPRIERAIDKGLNVAGNIADKVERFTDKARRGAEKAAEFALPIIAASGGTLAPEVAGVFAGFEAADLAAKGAKMGVRKVVEKKKAIRKDVHSILGDAAGFLRRI